MADKKLLAVFEIEIKNEKARFAIYGDYEIETGTDFDNNEYKYPEFYGLISKQIIDNKEIDYQPNGSTWEGRKYVVDDMLIGFITSLIQGGQLYTKIFLEEGLQELVDFYLIEDKIEITVNDLKIPKQILNSLMSNPYKLFLVTNEFIYYAYYDELLMLRTSNHEVVSDNYFASVGYWDSIENIKKGEETLLWGELPEEE